MTKDKLEEIKKEIEKATPSDKKRAVEAFTLAALGSIPWVGGFISAAATLFTDKDEIERDSLQSKWLEEHSSKLEMLQRELGEILDRFENFGERIDERIQSDEYLDIVRKSFRVWDKADTDEKRSYLVNLVANSGGTTLSSDDVVRLFIDWLETYHESHFAVITQIYKREGVTRKEIWENIYGEFPREDSAEADLYRMLIRELSIGGVIRQTRQVTAAGQFVRFKKPRVARGQNRTMESAFEGTKGYELTELGKQFVHYALTEETPRINEKTN